MQATFGDKEWIGRIAFFASVELESEALELAFTRFYLHTAIMGTSGAGKLIRVTVQNNASDECPENQDRGAGSGIECGQQSLAKVHRFEKQAGQDPEPSGN